MNFPHKNSNTLSSPLYNRITVDPVEDLAVQAKAVEVTGFMGGLLVAWEVIVALGEATAAHRGAWGVIADPVEAMEGHPAEWAVTVAPVEATAALEVG